MTPPIGPEQFASFLSADGIHNYVERFYGVRAARVAGGIIVLTFLVLCFSVLFIVGRAAIGLLSPSAAGLSWALPERGNALSLAVAVLALLVAWWALRSTRNTERALIEYVTERVEPSLQTAQERLNDADAHRKEHFEFFSNRLEALERHTSLPGANPLEEFLVQRYSERLREMQLRIHSASYGADTRQKDVTAILKNHVRDNVLELDVENETFGGDPAYHVVKQLTVVYSIGDDSIKHTVQVEEHKKLRLGAAIPL